jgi:hypothetical protein
LDRLQHLRNVDRPASWILGVVDHRTSQRLVWRPVATGSSKGSIEQEHLAVEQKVNTRQVPTSPKGCLYSLPYRLTHRRL